MIKISHIIFIIFCISNCQTPDGGEPSLDLVQEKKDNDIKDANIDWQKFFKKPSEKIIKKLVPTNKKGNKDLYAQAISYIQENNLTGAEHSLQAYLRIHGLSKEPLLELVMVQLRKHQVKDAFITLQSLRNHLAKLEDIPSGFLFRYRYTTAVAYLTDGDHKEGRRILVDLINKDKTFRPGYQALASSYLLKNQQQAARFIIQRGLDQSEASPAFYNLLGALEMQNQQTVAARGWFQKSLHMKADHTPTLINLAKLDMSQKQYRSAENHLQIAVKTDPNSIEALVTLGILKQDIGDHKKSLIAFQKALEIYPEHTVARFNMASLLADHLEEPLKALRYFHEVRQLSQPDQEMHKIATSYIEDMQ